MENTAMLSLLILVLIGASSVRAAANFTYENNGASKWPEQFPSYCNGSRQSPINIVSEKAAYNSNIGAFTFTNYNSDPENLTLPVNNTGHSITAFVADLKASISGTGLTAAYNAYQLHLHWGKDASSGSEHEIDGKKYVGELHIVHYKAAYGDLATAVSKRDGIAVLGMLLEDGDTNVALGKLLKDAQNLTKSGSTVDVDAFELEDLLPSNKKDFFRYDGSLTTPMCQESVIWTVFKNPIKISAAQLNALRAVEDTHGNTLKANYRPVQPLNGRTVQASFDPKESSTTVAPTTDGAASTIAAHPTVLFAMLALLFAR